MDVESGYSFEFLKITYVVVNGVGVTRKNVNLKQHYLATEAIQVWKRNIECYLDVLRSKWKKDVVTNWLREYVRVIY